MPKLQITDFLSPPTTELSPFVAQPNQLVICNGVNPSYKYGKLIKDLGYSQQGDAVEANKPITSLYHFRQDASVNKLLCTVNNAAGTNLVLAYDNAGTWTDIALSNAWDGFEDCNVEFESFIKYCFFVGYDDTDGVFLPVGSLTGTTFSTSTNVTNMPQAKYIKRYRDRLYIANCYESATAYPYRVWFSSIPASGAITWTVASDYIDVDFSEIITGLGENWDRLLIFTEFSAYMYNQAEKKKIWDVGCGNHRTIKNVGDKMIWANKDNVWMSNGGQPQAIGGFIKELIQTSTVSDWRAEVIDNEYHIHLGSADENGRSYSNCVAVFNIESSMWRWREYADGIASMARYTTGGDDFLMLGCDDGDVHKKSKYTDTTPIYADDGNPILSHFRTAAMPLGDPSVEKRIKKITAYAEYANGLDLRYRIYDSNQEVKMPFKPIGRLKKIVNEFKSLGLHGNFIQFEGKEYSQNKAWEFFGLTIEYAQDSDKNE